MKKLLAIFVFLFGTFLGMWAYKLNTPVARPDNTHSSDEGAWWTTGASVRAEEEWYLDPSIPPNYVPVPGEDNLFMVVDDEGRILGYKKRFTDAGGNIKFEDIDPNIPENYEPVPGLENVYRVTGEDGSIRYLKYIRNQDDTFAFVEVDEQGNMIGHTNDATKIDGKHIHIKGNTYSLLNDQGVVIGQETRVSNGDGTFSWQMDNSGTVPKIPDISLGDNASGGLALNPSQMDNSALDAMARQMQANYNAAMTPNTYNFTINTTNVHDAADGSSDQPVVEYNSDGTHTVTETHTRSITIDGKKETYVSYIKIIKDSNGNEIERFTTPEALYSTEEVPVISTASNQKGDPSLKEASLSREIARVTGSLTYNTSVANSLIAELNASRAKIGLHSLSKTEQATQIAQLRAADMAIYNTSDTSLPTYESLGTMLSFYGIQCTSPGETLWKANITSASEINTRLMTLDKPRETRMNKDATEVGIAIVEKDGYFYIDEVIL